MWSALVIELTNQVDLSVFFFFLIGLPPEMMTGDDAGFNL